ncbi:MAG: ATP-dependent Clp protease proteolytic subunit [bacterium]
MNIIPTVLEKSGNKEYAFDLYSRLLNDRIIFVYGEINDMTSNLIVSQLLYLDSINNNEIYMYINSPGGSVTAGFSIYDTMEYIKSDVVTIGLGMCASMGAFLLTCGTKGKRSLLPNTDVMIHQPLGGAQGQATDINIAAQRILKMRDRLNLILSEKTNQPIDKIQIDTDRDNYFDSKEALEYGLVDKIIK